MTGRFIVFEGIDGCGKSTQIQAAYRHLIESGHQVVLTFEPGGTGLAQDLRKVVKEVKNDEIIHGITELLIFNAARAQNYFNVIKPALDDGKIVLCDRYIASTIAFQSVRKGIPEERVLEIDEIVTGGARPDLTLVFDVDLDVSASRKVNRERPVNSDRFDAEGMDVMAKIKKSYLDQAAKNSDSFVVIPANDCLENVHDRVIDILSKYLGQTTL